MSRSNSDQNLLFGILALQLDFVDRDQLVAGMNSWVLEKSTPLADILREQASLTDEEHGLLSALVAKHLEKHRGDAEASLAALSSLGSARAALSLVPDRDVQATLNQVGKARTAEEHDTDKTLAVGQSTSQGARFRVLRPHATGGLGEVFVARDEELHREVALKEIQLQHAYDQDCRLRFTQEAEITGGLEHPGIVPVYGLGQYADGRPFYAMRFIRGDTLHDAIKHFHSATRHQRRESETALELRKLLGRFVDVCNAIAYAHSRGVLHRDLKPGNIMLGKYGETLVVDWGLAKLGSRSEKSSRETRAEGGEKTLHISPGSGSTPTQLGAAMGTPAFMSPEQAAGRIDELGPASDVYSLGATLYCLLTGQPPQSDDADDMGKILKKVERGEFPRPRQVQPRIPRALEAICLKAMALAPANRYSSPGALAEDIEHWLADEPTTALPESLYDRLFRLARRHRSVALAITIAAVLIAMVTGVASILVDQQRRVAQQLAQENAGLYRAEQQARKAADKATGAEKLAREKAEQLAREKTELAISEQQARSAAVKSASAETDAREKAEQLAKEKTDLALSEEQARKVAVKAKDAETAARQKADKLSEFLIGAIQPEDPTRFTGATFFAPKADYRSFTVFDMLKVELARARKELDTAL